MPNGSSQVVGLIEVEADKPLMPARSLRSTELPEPRICNVRLESPADVDIVHANLTQINDDLRVELASVVARIAQARSQN